MYTTVCEVNMFAYNLVNMENICTNSKETFLELFLTIYKL